MQHLPAKEGDFNRILTNEKKIKHFTPTMQTNTKSQCLLFHETSNYFWTNLLGKCLTGSSKILCIFEKSLLAPSLFASMIYLWFRIIFKLIYSALWRFWSLATATSICIDVLRYFTAECWHLPRIWAPTHQRYLKVKLFPGFVTSLGLTKRRQY